MRTSTGRARSCPGHSQAYWGCSGTATPCASSVSAICCRALHSGPEKQGPESDPPGGLGDPEGGRAVLPEGGGPSVSGGLQGADDPAGGMRRAHLGPGGEPPAVPRGVQGPHGPHWRPGGPGGGEGQLALQHEAVVGRRSPRLSGPLHLPQARLHQRHDQADGPGPLRPGVPDRCRWP